MWSELRGEAEDNKNRKAKQQDVLSMYERVENTQSP